MTQLDPNHNYAADECIAQIPQHHIPTQEEKVRASERFDKDVLVAAHMAALHDTYILEMATHPALDVIIKPSSPTSVLAGLKSSTLKQLKVGKLHRKRVLVGTLCSKTLASSTAKGVLVVNVLEDEQGLATPIYLRYDSDEIFGSDQAQRLYPQGSKVAIKEPYLTRLPDGEIILAVEKLSDFAFLWVPEAGKGKIKDEVAFASGEEGMQRSSEDSGPTCDDSADAAEEAVLTMEEEEEGRNKDVGSGVDEKEKVESTNDQSISNGLEAKYKNSSIVSKELKTKGVEADTIEIGGKKKFIAVQEGSHTVIREVRSGCLSEMQEDGVKEENMTREGLPEITRREVVEANRDHRLGDLVGDMKEREEEGEVNEEKQEEIEEMETAASLLKRGDALFEAGQLTGAAELYAMGARKASQSGDRNEEVLCMSNRAEALLRLGRNQSAVAEAEAALALLVEEVRARGVAEEMLTMAPLDLQLREEASKWQARLLRILKRGKRQRASGRSIWRAVGVFLTLAFTWDGNVGLVCVYGSSL